MNDDFAGGAFGIKLAGVSASGFAPSDATYVTLTTNATLTNERVLTGTSNQIILTDNGAGSTIVLSLPQSIALASTPQFASLTLGGLFLSSGSVINWDAGDLTLTQAANLLTLAGGVLAVPASGLSINGNLMSLAGAFTTSGANTLVLTTTGSTNVTLPSSGTLAILGANTFTGVQTINAALLAEVSIAAKTSSPYTVLSTESGRVFTNEGTTVSITFNLPTAVAGLTYTFIVQDADGIVVDANTGDTIRLATQVSASSGNATSTAIGSVLTLAAINATEWIATSINGTWVVT